MLDFRPNGFKLHGWFSLLCVWYSLSQIEYQHRLQQNLWLVWLSGTSRNLIRTRKSLTWPVRGTCIFFSLYPQIIKQMKTGTSLCQDVNLSIHDKMKVLTKKRRLNSPTNFHAIKLWFVSVCNIHETLCNLGHLGLSQSLAPSLSRAQRNFYASFISLLLLKTIWTSTCGPFELQTINFFLIIVQRTTCEP